jgi:hypothetical protein
MSSTKSRKTSSTKISETSSSLGEDKTIIQSLDLLNESLNDIIKNSHDSAFKCHMVAKLGANNLEQVEHKLSELLNKFKANNNINHCNYVKKLNLGDFNNDNEFKTQKNEYDDSDSDENFNILHSDIMLNTNNLKHEYDEDDDLFQLEASEDVCSSNKLLNDNLLSTSPNKDFDLLEENSVINSCNDLNNNNTNYYYDLLEKEEFEFSQNNNYPHFSTSYNINNISNDFDLILK